MVADLAWSLGLLAAVAASAWWWTSAVGLRGMLSRVIGSYVIGCAEIIGLGFLLSFAGWVGRPGYAISLAALAIAALVIQSRRGGADRQYAVVTIARTLRASAPAAIVALAALCSLVYTAVASFLTAPNNWDGLTYHLTKAIVWYQRHGIGWIENAPTDRINEFPGNAEVQVLFTYVMTGGDRAYALPQIVAHGVLVVGIAGVARRIGLSSPAAVFAGGLFALGSVVALEAGTAQNDLVVAALCVAAIFFVLERGTTPAVLVGLSVALAAGTKLTVVLALPIIIALSVVCQRSAERIVSAVAASVGFLALAAWWFVENVRHTDHLLGQGGGRVEFQAGGDPLGWLATLARMLFHAMDVAGLTEDWVVIVMATGGVVLAAATALLRPRGSSWRSVAVDAAVLAAPLFLFEAVLVLAIAYRRALFELVGSGINRPETTAAHFSYVINRGVDEDIVFFGPVVIVALAVAVIFGLREWRRAGSRVRGVLALAAPLGVVAVACLYRYNPWLARLLLVPFALSAPLLGLVHRYRRVSLGLAVAATLSIVAVHLEHQRVPVLADDPFWTKMRNTQTALAGEGRLVPALDRLDELAPGMACVGVSLHRDDAASPIAGAGLERELVFLEGSEAKMPGEVHVFVTTIRGHPLFKSPPQGWKTERVQDYWYLAFDPSGPGGQGCAGQRRT
ncbi:MAG: glycosyltransferase family 87 protein [Gaiella sp.]